MDELHSFVVALVRRINDRFRAPGYEPVVWVERPVPLYERMALLSVADCVVVTATRDGMNLLPYEYVVARQGAAAAVGGGGPGGVDAAGGDAAGGLAGGAAAPQATHSMLVVSEFVGCSPSLSGAIRVNPWSIEAVRKPGHRWERDG